MIKRIFRAKLWRVPGKGGWTFATVPAKHAPSRTLAWGRMPVVATVDGHTWKTSVWREKNGRVLLPVPKTVRGDKREGSTVQIILDFAL